MVRLIMLRSSSSSVMPRLISSLIPNTIVNFSSFELGLEFTLADCGLYHLGFSFLRNSRRVSTCFLSTNSTVSLFCSWLILVALMESVSRSVACSRMNQIAEYWSRDGMPSCLRSTSETICMVTEASAWSSSSCFSRSACWSFCVALRSSRRSPAAFLAFVFVIFPKASSIAVMFVFLHSPSWKFSSSGFVGGELLALSSSVTVFISTSTFSVNSSSCVTKIEGSLVCGFWGTFDALVFFFSVTSSTSLEGSLRFFSPFSCCVGETLLRSVCVLLVRRE